MHTTLHRINKTQFIPAPAGLSAYGQQTIPVDIVSKIAKSYLCPDSDNADRPHHQSSGHHHHHSKDMLNPAADLCSPLITLLFPCGKLAVFTALALHSFTKSPLLKQLYRLLRTIGRIGINISARIAPLQQLIKYQHHIIGLCSRIAFFIPGPERFQSRSKTIPRNHSAQFRKRVTVFVKLFKTILPIKKPSCIMGLLLSCVV